jgi:hypothetical protein
MPNNNKAKFEVAVDQQVQRNTTYKVHLTQDQVVSGLNLPPEEADNWKDHAQDYIEQNWDTVAQQPNTHQMEVDDEITDFTIESVEETN